MKGEEIRGSEGGTVLGAPFLQLLEGLVYSLKVGCLLSC